MNKYLLAFSVALGGLPVSVSAGDAIDLEFVSETKSTISHFTVSDNRIEVQRNHIRGGSERIEISITDDRIVGVTATRGAVSTTVVDRAEADAALLSSPHSADELFDAQQTLQQFRGKRFQILGPFSKTTEDRCDQQARDFISAADALADSCVTDLDLMACASAAKKYTSARKKLLDCLG